MFRKHYKFTPIFVQFTCFFWLNLHFLLLPILIVHDAVMHHALHVLDVPAANSLYLSSLYARSLGTCPLADSRCRTIIVFYFYFSFAFTSTLTFTFALTFTFTLTFNFIRTFTLTLTSAFILTFTITLTCTFIITFSFTLTFTC